MKRGKTIHFAWRVLTGGRRAFEPDNYALLCVYSGFTACVKAYNVTLTTEKRNVTCKLCLEVLEARKRGGLPC